MKKFPSVFFLFVLSVYSLVACKKINEPTELGSDLIPPIDNVNTFETYLATVTDNQRMIDSTRVEYNDLVALGDINDPEFGNTHANLAFTITPLTLGSYPFINKDSVYIDSVVLSLSYQGAFGDTMSNGIQTLRVYEIGQNSGFRDDTTYRYADPSSDFAANAGGTTGTELGSKTYTIKNIKDSITLIRRRDTSKVANVVRIRLDNSIGTRFAQYDTAKSSPTGGYYADTTKGGTLLGSQFRKLFRGLAIRAENSGNALAYFSLADISKTKLIVYFRATKNGVTDTTSYDFIHRSNGRANFVNQTPANQWASYLNNGISDDKLYIQSSPSGSYASIVVPALSTFENSVIHRAEIIASVIPSAQSNIYRPPSQLFIDRTNKSLPDTAFLLENDILLNPDISFNLQNFGGTLRSDNTYRFNITRYVQSLVTKKEPNDTLRLYAPNATTLFVNSIQRKVQSQILNRIASGRAVLGGGTFTDPTKQLRLRIVYSKI